MAEIKLDTKTESEIDPQSGLEGYLEKEPEPVL